MLRAKLLVLRMLLRMGMLVLWRILVLRRVLVLRRMGMPVLYLWRLLWLPYRILPAVTRRLRTTETARLLHHRL